MLRPCSPETLGFTHLVTMLRSPGELVPHRTALTSAGPLFASDDPKIENQNSKKRSRITFFLHKCNSCNHATHVTSRPLHPSPPNSQPSPVLPLLRPTHSIENSEEPSVFLILVGETAACKMR